MGCDCWRNLDGIRDALAKPGKPAVSETISTEGPIDETLYGKKLEGAETKSAGSSTGSEGKGPGEHGALGSLRFCNWAAPEWGPTGEFNWDDAFRAAALIIALANGVAQSQIADMQHDMAKSKWDRFYQKFVPLEKKLLNEVLTEPLKEMDCADDRQRADSWVGRAYGAMQE